MSRPASHSGSWYSSNAEELEEQFEKWLDEARNSNVESRLGSPKIIISPHAGYRYSGPTAAHSFLQIAEYPSEIERIFVIGPSHRENLRPFAQSTTYSSLETPLGPLCVDTDLVKGLGLGGMGFGTDLAEHSLEMQFPFLKYVLVGNLSRSELTQLADLIYPQLIKEGTLLLVSTDFCHWGQPFDYAPDLSPETSPLHDRIKRLDERGMQSIEAGPENFAMYLDTTKNTICGREPIRVALELVQKGALRDGRWCWLHYSQSNQLTSPKSTSSQVSYVSGAYFI